MKWIPWTSIFIENIDVCSATALPAIVHFVFVFLCNFVVSSCNTDHFQSSCTDRYWSQPEPGLYFRLDQSILPEIVRPPGAPWVIVVNSNQCWRWRERKQKRGCRADYRIQLRKQQHKPLLSSIFLTNARFLANKMEELQSETYYNCFVWKHCVLIVTEAWLHLLIPDVSVELPGQTLRL